MITRSNDLVNVAHALGMDPQKATLSDVLEKLKFNAENEKNLRGNLAEYRREANMLRDQVRELRAEKRGGKPGMGE